MRTASFYKLSIFGSLFLTAALALQNCSDRRPPAEATNIGADSAVVEPADKTDAATPADTAEVSALNTLTATEKEQGWRLLFDGKSTEAWRGYNQTAFPAKGWKVENEMLVVEGTPEGNSAQGGDIVTKDKFENFELKLDFKLSPGANSGILYRVKEKKDGPIWNNAPEYQLIDNDAWASKIDIKTHGTASNYDMEGPTANAMKPVGEWNEAMVRIKNDTVEHWLNGQKVLQYIIGSPTWKAQLQKSKFREFPDYGVTRSGNIGIQDHGHQLWFRNIKIRTI